MADVRPFRALRPRDDLAERVIAPPYDVLTEAEARGIAQDPHSFVRVTRSEVDLPEGSDPHSDEAYQQAKANLTAFVEQGWLQRDEQPTYYLYGQTMGEHRQVGVLAACSVEEYDQGLIAKHEYTRPDKEDDRTHHMDVLDHQVGLVFLTYRNTPKLAFQLGVLTNREPAWRVTTEDGVEHALWPVEADWVERIREAFAEVPKLYIADGHHRSAAASRIHALRGTEQSAFFLAGLFPHDKLMVLPYNRVVHDLNGLDAEGLLEALRERFEVTQGPSEPVERGHISMYLAGAWHRLVPKEVPDDVVGRLDVAVLQHQVLQPLLGIDDPRRSSRITFVGGIHGPDRVQQLTDAREQAVGFVMYPTGLEQLFDVADAGEVMPPKSTWFEPKLREGVVVRPL
jgi:uncharacterized protein (DUF1015 family)